MGSVVWAQCTHVHICDRYLNQSGIATKRYRAKFEMTIRRVGRVWRLKSEHWSNESCLVAVEWLDWKVELGLPSVFVIFSHPPPPLFPLSFSILLFLHSFLLSLAVPFSFSLLSLWYQHVLALEAFLTRVILTVFFRKLWFCLCYICVKTNLVCFEEFCGFTTFLWNK